MKILVFNAGSSSQKSYLYEVGDNPPLYPPKALWKARIEWEGESASLRVQNSHGAKIEEERRFGSRKEGVAAVLEMLWTGEASGVESTKEINAVGHRIVHGGERLHEPTVLTAEVRSALGSLASLAPVHVRVELEGMEVVEEKLGDATQIGVFDTAFHRTLPDYVATYPVPREWIAMGIRKYGFHGINHRYCAERAAEMLGADSGALRLVTCHLGNGCSLAAIRGGRSVDTTMGFTPLEGLMMGTRSGSIDPAIVTYLIREGKLTAQEAEDALNKQSGLLAVSGMSSDMRKIVAAMKEGHVRAKLAFEMFVHRLRGAIGAMAGSVGGVDALVFSGGIGENSREVRAAACEGLSFMGVRLDSGRNSAVAGDGIVSSENSAVSVLVIQAQEDWAIARECHKLMTTRRKQGTLLE